MIDPFALAYYAAICGLLSLSGPRLGRAPMRFGVGVLVGLVAASLLPALRTVLG